jgi:hypothetical protein
MNDSVIAIHSLLNQIQTDKGEIGRVEILCTHWRPENAGERGIIAAKPIPKANTSKSATNKIIQVGEYCEFEGVSPINGYLHLFNFGTSGYCLKLAPSMEYQNNYIDRNAPFRLPSEQFLSRKIFDAGVWREGGPTTTETGQLEQLLIIATRDDIDLQIEDLHPKLLGNDLLTRCSSRGPSFSGSVKTGVSKLFRLPLESWEYGLLQMEVR